MKFALSTAFLALIASLALAVPGNPSAVAASPPDLTGTWSGMIQFPDVKLRLVFNLQRSGAGYKATLDSVDQGARDIPVDSIEFSGDKLTMEIKAVQATFEGKVNTPGTYITGKWTHHGRGIPFNLERTDAPLAAGDALTEAELGFSRQAALKFCGVWEGTVTEAGRTNTLRAKIWRGADGRAKGAFDSDSQKSINLPLRRILLRESKLTFEAPGLGAAFEGSFVADGGAVAGEWQHAGNTFPLVLKRLPTLEPGKR